MLILVTSESFGLAISSMVPSADVGNLLATLILTLWFAVGGFFVKNDRIRWYFYPFAYTSINRYGYGALVQNEFFNASLNCDLPCNLTSQLITFNGTTFDVKSIEDKVCESFCIFRNGFDLIKYVVSDNIPIWGNVLVLIGMIFIWRIIAFLFLKYKRWEKK